MKIAHFIKQVLAIAIGCFISLLGLLLIAFVILSQLMSPNSTRCEVKRNSVLELDMAGKVVELMPDSLYGVHTGIIDLKVVKRAIRQATEDSCIKAIYLKLSFLQAEWTALEEIRDALLAFKKQGKAIVAYGDSYSHKSYYLASVADEIVVNPSGCLTFQGLSATVNFYTKLFENVFIEPIIFRIGDYKSAVEPFCLNKMSQENKQQLEVYFSFLYEHFLTNIGLSRNIQVSALKAFANDLSAVLPDDALHKSLITRVDYEVEAQKLLKAQLDKADGEMHTPFINYKHYASSKKQANVSSSSRIAVVVAEGEIIDGPTTSGYVGARDFVKTIAAIQKDATIKAVVLRINSPGGGVLASDVMWKAIEELKVTKPVVASMSNVAASGGYYIAAPCHYIFAHPTTITGSIGIFGLLFDPAKLMKKIGIESDVVKTAPSADLLNPRMTCLPAESKLIYKLLQASYDTFIRKVALGRGLQLEQVEKIASGRIYAGTLAQKNGLVDELGNLEAAIQKAASLANLTEKYDICYLPRPKTKLEQLLLYYTGSNIKGEIMDALLERYPMLNYLDNIHRRQGLKAMLPYTIDTVE